MRIFNLFEKSKPKNDPEFAKTLDAHLEICEFSDEIKKGFLFFLGWSTPLDSEGGDNTTLAEKLISLYSVPSGDFAKYGELNDYVFAKTIYTTNYILHKQIFEGVETLETNLRSVSLPASGKQHIILKTDVDDAFASRYDNLVFKLEPITNFYDEIFTIMGRHLHQTGFSFKKSYEAGFAFYNMQMHMDLKGTQYLIAGIRETLPPLYSTFRRYPMLYTLHPKEFYSNHPFSSILWFFYSGISKEIIEPIHKYHQVIFYEPGTTTLRSVWQNWNEDSIMNVFLNAASIRKTEFSRSRDEFLKFNDMQMPELKGAKIDIEQLFELVQKILTNKFGLSLFAKCNHRGEFMQMLAVLYYETCLHAMVLEELDFKQYA